MAIFNSYVSLPEGITTNRINVCSLIVSQLSLDVAGSLVAGPPIWL